jgi:anti-sigma regulatory factor (Ser/Thr protein kinase)
MQQCAFTCEASLGAIPALREYLQANAPLPEKAVSARLKLQLIVEELFTNSIRHGGSGVVKIILVGEDHRVHIRYEDNGNIFDPFNSDNDTPLQRPADKRVPVHLGLILIRAFAEHARHEVLAEGGNRIVLSLRY